MNGLLLLAAGVSAACIGQAEPKIAYHVPGGIDQNQFVVIAETLNLSAEQHQFGEQLRAAYMEHVQREIGAKSIELDAYARHAGRGMARGEYDILSVQAFEDLCDIEHRTTELLRTLDTHFFDVIQSHLAPSQVELLEFVRLRRSREYANTMARPFHPATIDLARFFQRPDVRQVIQSSTTGPSLRDVDVALFAYDRRVTPIWLEYEEEARRVRIRFAHLINEAQFDEKGDRIPVGSPAEAARSEALAADLVPVLVRRTSLLKQIWEVNSAEFERISATIEDPGLRRALESLWKRTCFPQVYPDELDPIHLLEELVAEDIPEDGRVQLELLSREHLHNWQEASDQMCQRLIRWRLEYAATQSMKDHQAYRREMRDLRDRRWAVSIATTERAIEACGALATSTIQRLRDHRSRCERVTQEAAFDDFPRL